MKLNRTHLVYIILISLMLSSMITIAVTHQNLTSKGAIFRSEISKVISYTKYRRSSFVERYKINRCSSDSSQFNSNLVTSLYILDKHQLVCQTNNDFGLIKPFLNNLKSTYLSPQGVIVSEHIDDMQILVLLHKDFILKRAQSVYGNALHSIQLRYADVLANKPKWGSQTFGNITVEVGLSLTYLLTVFVAFLFLIFSILMLSICYFNNRYDQQKQLVKCIKKAIKQQSFHMHYQPLVNHSNQVHGFEALIRWSHPIHGLIAPDKFIPVAEEFGLISDLTDCVFETVLNELSIVKSKRPSDAKPLHIGINVPPSYINEKINLIKMQSYFNRFISIGYQPVIELTERELITEQSLVHLHSLKKIGYSLAIDDFGTGYTGLAMLSQLPIDYLKIDRFFINGIGNDSVNLQLLDTMISLGNQLGLTVVAEGIETEQQKNYLKEKDCHCLQGYLFAKPTSWSEAIKLI